MEQKDEAYFRWVNRGRPSNDDLADWYASNPQKDSLAERELQKKHWERVAWVVATIGALHAIYTTWNTGWIYVNSRRDVILGIGQERP
jgi:hypothetical protein